MIALKNISILTYVALFGGIWGYAMYGKNMIWMWLSFELVGGVCFLIKNKRTTDRYFKHIIRVADIFITLFLIIISSSEFIPMIIKMILFFSVVLGYLLIYFNLLFKGKLINQTSL
ncbi:hypothetical protein NIE88_19840 [Sporolactobacillus shoreicorticis]|uniref:Uncharacterized protein n=1 Tax=Sporolactobacillus shoreicorticis TaxID=1923877 RepID=A0ABW5S2S6_9BACL|nr:hypothetical protein [Sporolactobacillus shoreicorticis]MCO7127997.1 hypothetical protein [Sporolactobacillus shoreicorticis]